eukprot:CAMPEP_0175792586 /NCGR_PEP_ID=MMETSP0097-20121207/83038_1 /TAXON_ID=311494 /ORGANISM="Alexandrium monilatum, Strain CCMP3105" /LENGTH=129 /DNA_ID=CAMNT_0017103769 /DNA_START=181 /DNA_END=568 /DNA_ORIENTATION=-
MKLLAPAKYGTALIGKVIHQLQSPQAVRSLQIPQGQLRNGSTPSIQTHSPPLGQHEPEVLAALLGSQVASNLAPQACRPESRGPRSEALHQEVLMVLQGEEVRRPRGFPARSSAGPARGPPGVECVPLE